MTDDAMTDTERLMSEIAMLRETIRREWFAISLDELTPEQRLAVQDHIKSCHDDLKTLLDRLWVLEE